MRDFNGRQLAPEPWPDNAGVELRIIRRRDGKDCGTIKLYSPKSTMQRNAAGELEPVPGQIPVIHVVIQVRGEQVCWLMVPLRDILGRELVNALHLAMGRSLRPDTDATQCHT
jgi:hypothetical protein